MIKPWVFEFFPAPREPGATTDPQRSADYFNWYLDLWPRAELLGYEGIFFSEHHFGPAYSPAPNLLIAQVALKTRTIRLGVMGLVLPYHQPWKIVEEIGMLQLPSCARSSADSQTQISVFIRQLLHNPTQKGIVC